MFTLQQINEAHAKVKTGADFPHFVQDLIKLGVKSYHTYVTDGHVVFFGEKDFQVQSPPKYAALHIAADSNTKKFTDYLRAHQNGQTDYPGFCSHAAETGVEKWTVDTSAMTCTYYDTSGRNMLEEKIPAL